jgi:hypothetical protein
MEKKIVFGKMPKPKRTPKLKGRLVITHGPLFTPLRIKDECFKQLTERSNALAEKARSEGTLEDLDGELRCECEAAVGAKKTSMGDWLEPSRHSTYKAPRSPARKRDYGKRM